MDFESLREDFPILKRTVNGRKLVYFDNAATTQKPRQVIDAVAEYYSSHNANIHRGLHELSQEASEMYEKAHDDVARFIHARHGRKEVVFTRNATESINLVAYSLGLSREDEVIATIAEHHSNFVPWQQLATLRVAHLKDWRADAGQIEELITERTRLIAVTHASNVLGNFNDIGEIAKVAKRHNIPLLVDAAQSAPRMELDVSSLGADFVAFSGHKMLGPTGIGVLWMKKEWGERMGPFLYGGDMISRVSIRKTEWNELPWKFEAGTPNIAGGIGLGKAVEYLKSVGMGRIEKREKDLGKHLIEVAHELELEVVGPDIPRSLLSFNLKKLHFHDVSGFLNEYGIATRSGMHCAHPLFEWLGIGGCARASLYFYNTHEEIELFRDSLKEIKSAFG